MNDLRERLRDAADGRDEVDVHAVRRRAGVLRRQRTAMRVAPIVAIVVGALVVMPRLGGDDGEIAPMVTDGGSTTSVVPTVPTTAGVEPTERAGPTTSTTAPDGSHCCRAPIDHELSYEDRAGDTRLRTATTLSFVPPSGGERQPEPELDIVGGSVTLTESHLRTAVHVDDLTDAGPAGSDGGAWATKLTIWDDGEERFVDISARRYNGLEEVFVLVYPEVEPCDECLVAFDATDDVVSVVVPRAVIDRLLGGDGLDAGDRIAGPGAETSWLYTERDEPGEREGSFAGAVADTAAGPGRSFTL